jgi:hypothetical protein
MQGARLRGLSLLAGKRLRANAGAGQSASAVRAKQIQLIVHDESG